MNCKILFLLVLLLSVKVNMAQISFELRDEVDEYVNGKVPNLQTAFIAEAVKGDYRTAIVWPCVIEGEYIDDDIIGLVYKKVEKKWEFVKEIGAFSGNGQEKIAEAMGGEFEVIKPDGLKDIKDLPEFIFQQAKEVKVHLDNKNDKEAVKAIEKMATAFSIEMAGYSDGFSEIVISGLFQNTPMILSDIDGQSQTPKANLTMGSITGKVYFAGKKGNWKISSLGE